MAKASTDSKGLPLGSSSVSVSHDQHQKLVKDVELRPGTNAYDFQLEAGREISGRVIDGTGLPVQGARVKAEAPRGGGGISITIGGGRRQRGASLSGQDGSFVLKGLADGNYVVKAEKTGFASAQSQDLCAARRFVGLRR